MNTFFSCGSGDHYLPFSPKSFKISFSGPELGINNYLLGEVHEREIRYM